MPGARVLALAEAAGRAVWHEGFPDRGYDEGGRLLPRDDPDAVLTDSALIAERALALADRVASLCLHGDTPGAVAHAVAVREALVAAGWRLRGL
jgi:UPF0271 protein